ncbi:protein ULTRAPETALA 1-like isoform X2 [Musa acuminata AAA Group]|uniref:protein ULTRAPETALA 1-like isoform X2 n=1 Tax=Musa acuminata AAA Group TaxID=214697 RepID=UPI0031D700B3
MATLSGGLGFSPPVISRSAVNARRAVRKPLNIVIVAIFTRQAKHLLQEVSISQGLCNHFLQQHYKLTPAAFEKHSGRETARKWKNNVWIIIKGDKVPLSKTVLLKYYNQASKAANGSHKGPNGRPFHRDEFVCCKRCNKERRFRLRTKDEYRNYHDAVRNPNWECSNLTFDRATCDDEEERASRKVLRGCSRSPSCRGCTTCVCFGCENCRFSDCSCQTCIDYTRNSKI